MVRNRVVESEGKLVEPLKVQGDLQPEVLLGGQIAEEAERLHEVPARRISKDIVDAGSPVHRGDPVPVFLGGVCGSVFIRRPLRNVVPPFLSHLEEERASSDVGVGVHTEEIRGIANPGSSLGSLFEEGRTVPPRVPVEGGDADAVGVPSASAG